METNEPQTDATTDDTTETEGVTETETEGDQEIDTDPPESAPEAVEGFTEGIGEGIQEPSGDLPEVEVYEFDEILQMTLTELALLPSTLLHQAVGADRAMIQDLLYSSATYSTAALAGDESAAKEIAMISATLNDISIKYGIRARVAVQETINRFIFRVIDATLDAAIPG